MHFTRRKKAINSIPSKWVIKLGPQMVLSSDCWNWGNQLLLGTSDKLNNITSILLPKGWYNVWQWIEELFSSYKWVWAVLLCRSCFAFYVCGLFLSLGCEFQQLVTDPWKLGYSAFQRLGHRSKIANGWLAGETLN